MAIEFDVLKKKLQRLEWWPEYNIKELSDYIDREGITAEQLVDAVKRTTLNPDRVLARITGDVGPADYFQRTQEEMDEMVSEWDSYYNDNFSEPQKVCFITCCNDQNEYDEMLGWIARLYVPQNIVVETIEITEARSMCSGYNEAMRATDALYKVYLHQDIRILNPFFIYDILLCFARHPEVGLLGVVGATEVPEDGIMWHGERVGAIVETEDDEKEGVITYYEEHYALSDRSAELIDGVLMVTRYDLDWREDLFDGFDFYDASQSREFRNHGYEIIVPAQKLAWCLHDFRRISWNRYEEGRRVFVDNYIDQGKGQESMSIKEQMREYVDKQNCGAAYELLSKNLREEIPYLKNDPQYCVLAATVYLEKANRKIALDFITMGLLADKKNYELYLTLGEYYAVSNINQALLCYYQALYYCDDEDDRGVIESFIAGAIELGAEIKQVSFVIVTHDEMDHIADCINSIVSTIPDIFYEIIVVDNASEDGTKELLSNVAQIKYIYNQHDIGYTKGVNKGIKECDPYNDVFLLDPCTRLIDNSFFYLMLGLYSQGDVGIISGITNDYIIDQKMFIDTSDMEEAIKLADTVNCPIYTPWEKVIYVSDFAMLIKREAIDKVGMLDESFSPYMYEDKDFCTRVNLSGFKTLLCYNSYIFCFKDKAGGDKDIEKKNARLFNEKWGCNIDYSNNARSALLDMIKKEEDDSFEVLELGCAMGSTLNRIKFRWPNAVVHGVEYDAAAARIGASLTDIIQGDVENMMIPYAYNQFDYIICADVLEHLRSPEDTIRRFLPYLKDDGFFIVSIPNVRHHAVLAGLVQLGRFDYADSGILDRTHLKFFTRDTAIEMLESSGLRVVQLERNYNGEPGQSQFIDIIKKSMEVMDAEEMKVFQYYFLAEKQ